VELRSYWRVLRRRRWVVLGVTLLALIAAVVSVAALPQPLPTYQATVVIAVRPTNIPPPANNPYGDYYHYIASEYLNDDIMAIVESGSFKRVVSARYADRPEGPPDASIKGKKAHRVVTFTVSADRRSVFPLKIFVEKDALGASTRRTRRGLTGTEEYAVAKLRLFQAFDELNAPLDAGGAASIDLRVDQANLDGFLQQLDL